MDLATLSLSALPAASGLVQQAAKTGGQLGNSFLELLHTWTAPAADAANAEDGLSSAVPAQSQGSGPDGLSTKTRSWCERLVSWLRREHGVQSLDARVTLDQLDQPQLEVQGDQADDVLAALEQDPTWLQEFRELALDRAGQLAPSSMATPPSLALTLQLSSDDQPVVARWQ